MTELLTEANYLNESKYQRALKEIKDSGRAFKDDAEKDAAVKELYLKFGGAIAGDTSSYKGVPDEIVARVAEVHEEIVVEKKKKKGKK